MQRVIGFILLLGITFGGWAQVEYPFTVDDSARVVYVLDEVIVYYPKPARNPNPVLEITDTRIEEQSANSLADVIKYDPGLLVTAGRKNSSELRIRGSKKESVLFLLDGRPLNAGYFGSSDLSLLPVDQIEKIQVVKGPASVVYGANAMGGIVNIITKGGVGVPLNASVKSLFGDLNTREISGSIGGSFGDYSGWLTVEESNRDAYQLSNDFEPSYLEDGGTRNNSDQHRVGGHFKIGKHWNNRGNISLMFSYIRADKGLPSSTRDANYWRFVDWMRAGGNLSALYQLHPTLNFKGSVFANHYFDELISYQDNTFSMDRINYDSQLYNWTYGTTSDIQWIGISNHMITMGFKGQEDRSKKRDIDKDLPWGKYSTRTGSLFLEDRWQITPDIMLTGGVGWHGFYKTQASQGNDILCPMVSVTKEFPWTITTHLGMSRSILFPTLHNLYSRSSGNENLKPEETWKYEFNVEQFFAYNKSRYLSPQLAIFYNHTLNQIDKSPWTGIYRNILEVNTWGVETGVEWGANRWLSGDMTWAWLNWEKDYFIILETPHQKISGRFKVRTPIRTRINMEMSWFGKRNAEGISGATISLPDYMVFHANLNQPVTSWLEFRCEARNILDANYEEEYGYPSPGRQILVGVSINYSAKNQ